MHTSAGSSVPSSETFSAGIFGLDWAASMPWDLDGGVRMVPASVDHVLAFVGDHYGAIFAQDTSDRRFLRDPMSPAKLRFLAQSDLLGFYDGDRMIGLLSGHPFDWSSYYWRSVAFLPEYQGRGLLKAALERADRVLREVGVERVEGEAAPTNQRQLRLLMSIGYCVTGSVNSERFGTMLKLTKFLSSEARVVFTTQFCSGPGPDQSIDHRARTKGGHDEEVCHPHALRSASARIGRTPPVPMIGERT